MSVACCTELLPDLLQHDIDHALDSVRRTGSSRLLTYTEALPEIPDLIAFLRASASVLGDGILWSQNATGLGFAGAGAAFDVRTDGPERFSAASHAVRGIRETVMGNEPGERFPVIGGFAFDHHGPASPAWQGFPGARLAVPSVLVQIEGDGALLRLTREIRPTSSHGEVIDTFAGLLDRARGWLQASRSAPSLGPVLSRQPVPSRQAWEASVARALAMISAGAIDKIVVAREERVQFASPISPFAVLSHLSAVDPGSTLFGMQSGDSWFVGATPERLVRLDERNVDVTCLAGSVAIGDSPVERQRNAERLLASAKDREEHEIVVRSTQADLAGVCERVTRFPDTPRVTPARSVQHLETRLSGQLCRSGTILDLVARLHPTPAVGGFPRDRVAATLRELEEIDRGWYAGPFGWLDLEGSGEFVVAIRSALLAGATASLFAGCGIVAGSNPQDEFNETLLKLTPMLSALDAQ